MSSIMSHLLTCLFYKQYQCCCYYSNQKGGFGRTLPHAHRHTWITLIKLTYSCSTNFTEGKAVIIIVMWHYFLLLPSLPLRAIALFHVWFEKKKMQLFWTWTPARHKKSCHHFFLSDTVINNKLFQAACNAMPGMHL